MFQHLDHDFGLLFALPFAVAQDPEIIMIIIFSVLYQLVDFNTTASLRNLVFPCSFHVLLCCEVPIDIVFPFGFDMLIGTIVNRF